MTTTSSVPGGRDQLRYRLGIDVGTGSLGWAMLELDGDDVPFRIIDMGSRIFGSGREPKTLTSLAANRRQARQMRRRRDRYIQRRTRLMHELVAAGLMPASEEERGRLKHLDPFELRHRGIRERLEPFELGRALYHLQQRRGFKSNRKVDRGNHNEKSAMKKAIKDLDAKLGEHTVGSYMYERIRSGQTARIKPVQKGSKNEYDFYVDRAMIEEEFSRLWEAQQDHHPGLLTPVARERIHHAIFDQRPLKPVDPGRCTLETDEKRAPIAMQSSQLFRIYQEVNALRVSDEASLTLRMRPLTREERDKAVAFLRSKAKPTLSALKKVVFGKQRSVQLSLEAGERVNVLGDIVSAELSKPTAIGARWFDLTLDEQDAITRILHDADSDEEVIRRLTTEAGLTEDEAQGAAEAKLPDGYYRLSTKAIRRILPHLEGWDEEGNVALTYDRAVVAAGYRSHSDLHTGELYDLLPYYGEVLHRYTQDLANRDSVHVTATANADEREYGRIANPTVHVGLNQLRLVVNTLIKRYGPPTEVHIEVARDLGQSAEGRREAASLRAKNEKRNDELRAQLTALGQSDSYANRMRLKLYEELTPLNQVCVLCGDKIERYRLFQPGEYDVDHILPYSRTLDDSFNNKILIHNRCNKFKGNRSPYEAYSDNYDVWPHLVDRAELAYKDNKAKLGRFSADAMEKYENGEQDFIARQMTDTSYLARVAREYFTSLRLAGDDGFHPKRIVVMPGRLTGLLRGKWGLNSLLSDTGEKERSDHRHHAIDAVVIALSDRSTLKAVTDANKKAEAKYAGSNDEGMKKLLDDLPEPWKGFHDEIATVVDRIVVSHKPDHNERGQLHEETAWGVKDGPDKDGRYLVAMKGDLEGKWRPVVPIFRRGEGPDSALPYKAYVGGSNYCIEIVRTSAGKWEGEVISTFQANQRDYQEFMNSGAQFHRESFSGRPLVMRLLANDCVVIEREPGQGKIFRLQKIATQMYFAPVAEGNMDDRVKKGLTKAYRPMSDPLRKVRARKVFVDPIGRVFDPGFKE